jgi:hypothetical protein
MGENSILPVHRGQIQSAHLGCSMECWTEEGLPAKKGETGDLVCTRFDINLFMFFLTRTFLTVCTIFYVTKQLHIEAVLIWSSVSSNNTYLSFVLIDNYSSFSLI